MSDMDKPNSIKMLEQIQLACMVGDGDGRLIGVANMHALARNLDQQGVIAPDVSDR